MIEVGVMVEIVRQVTKALELRGLLVQFGRMIGEKGALGVDQPPVPTRTSAKVDNF